LSDVFPRATARLWRTGDTLRDLVVIWALEVGATMAAATTETSSLARYVPRLSAEWELHTDQRWQEIDGTLCYIDISGFTALSEKLARRGRIGAEELTEVLNYVFGKMLAVAYDRGGSLLKFGGDALLLVFTGSDHPIQASSAAVEMQAVLREARDYQTSAGRLYLKMSVGLHSGTVHLFRVGDSHKELILTGPAASMTTEMEETAAAGEVLISSATKESIPAGAATKRKGDGWLLRWRKARIECCGWSPRKKLDPHAVATGMPVALRDFLQHGAAEPEHHIATVGFIKFQGVDALMESGGPTAVAEALDELVRNVQVAADEEGVTFLASDIDEDGGKIILVAGVPKVQEDDEGRVLRAARRISDRQGQLPLRIGINQGHVFVGEIGTDFRSTYTVMGDTVNLAARLMAAASPGEVYASPSALDRAQTIFETTPLEPFYVKGKEHPVQAYAVGAETGSRPTERGGDLPFAGREEELAALHAMIDDLFAGKGHAVAITGERGIGKSRLVDEILPVLDKAEHIDVRAEAYGIGTPYRPLRDPVRELLGVERDSPPAMAKALQGSIARLAPEHLTLSPLVADVAMIEIPDTPEVDVIDPQFRQDRTADLLIELYERVHEGPVFFEVEDGHYMDEASAHIMERIAAATADHPWLVLTTRRGTADGFDPGMEEVELGPLSVDEARAMVVAATEAAPLRPHDVDVIVQRAGGLPLFLEEIIGAVRQAGGVEALPDSLDAVVSSQIDALPILARSLLRFSSVLGRSFRISALNQLMADEGIQLDAATRRELLGFLDPDGRDRLRFRHAMIRDVAYRGLSFKRRRELHNKAGEAAEQAAGAHPESAADVLALHFSLGQDHDRAWRYSRIAGDQAGDSYANVDAAAHYQRALESVRHLPAVGRADRAEVWTDLGDVSERAGLFDKALEAYRKAQKLVEDDVDVVVDLTLKRSNVHRLSGSYSSALRETTRGERVVDRAGVDLPGGRARLMVERASVRRWQQRPAEALALAEGAEALARSSGDLETVGRALDLIDWANRMLGRTDEPVHYDEALAIFEKLDDLASMSPIMNNQGAHLYWEGHWDDAIEAYRKAREVELRRGNDVQAAIGAANIGELLVNQRLFGEAEPLLRDAVRVLQASNHAPAAMFAEGELARLLVAKGDYGDGESLLEELKERSLQVGEPMSALNASIQLADSKLRQGEPEEGLRILDEAVNAAGDMAQVFAPTITRIRGCCLADVGRFDDGLEQIGEGLGMARDQGLLYDEALLLVAKNEITTRAGDDPDSDEVKTANRLFDEMDIRREPVLTV